MELRSKIVGPYELQSIVAKVSADKYEGNLDCGPYAGIRGVPRQIRSTRNGITTNWTLTCKSSREPGARRVGTSGRRSIHATWQAHYDVMEAIFEADPQARIRSGIATYDGVQEFRDKAGDTRYHNVGSMFQPAYLGDQ